MRKNLTVILVLFLSFAFAQKEDLYRVIHVVDGQSIFVSNVYGEVIRVKIDGIECPEPIEKLYGIEAREFVISMIFEKNVSLNFTGQSNDSYVFATVLYGADHRNIAEDLLQLGLAWHSKDRYDIKYVQLEESARNLRLGIWSEQQPTASLINLESLRTK
jgi:endonuclease YncB( thermonuclease family)